MVPARGNPSSVLGIDCGRAFTKAALIEPVDGCYRLIARGIARTSTDTHIFDGISHACSQIEAVTGRQLFVKGEPIAGDVSGNRGVEAMAVSLTCQPALRVLATNRDAAAAAERGLCQVSRLSGGTLRERLEQAQSHEWDAVVGTRQEVAEAAPLLPGLDGLDAADSGPAEDLGPRQVVGDAAAIERQLAELSLDRALRSIPGMAELVAASTEPVQTGPAAMAALARLIALRFRLRLAIADCGASAALLAVAGPNVPTIELRCDRPLEGNVPLAVDELKRSHRLADQVLSQ
ncbi:MAG: hypothetical protein KGJ86_07190, partial [Chloroflexota bacterium]|nr:hypothetical protein [Chloroflexota bacterium]